MGDEEFEDDDYNELPEYSPKSEFSKARLCEQTVNRCLESRGSEMKEGYFNVKLDKYGNPIKTWIPDSREKFIGCVSALLCLLSPEIKRDKKIKEDIKEFEKACEDLKEMFIYEEFQMYSENGIVKYKKTGRKYMPNIDDKVVIEAYDERMRKNIGKGVVGGWNAMVNAYKNELVEVYDYIFSKLNDLIDRSNYFKQSASF